jgi:uncharacterized phage-associated protein
MADEKLQSAVAYLARKLSPGKVKLFKLLYLADFHAHTTLGHSITGEMYENFDMGPVPVTLWKNFTRITNNCVIVREVETGVIPEQKITPMREFFIDLTADERAILDDVVERFGSLSGNALRDYTHQTIPYKATKRGDTIPYGLAAYLSYQKPSRADLDDIVNDASLMEQLREALLNSEQHS